jgi:hypothetical protein
MRERDQMKLALYVEVSRTEANNYLVGQAEVGAITVGQDQFHH